MKAIQMNLWQGRLLPAARDFLRSENPDVACLQEVYSFDPSSPSLDFFSGLEVIQAALPNHQCYYSPVAHFAVLDRYVSIGNAIFSRFPMSGQETTFINGECEEYNTLDAFEDFGNQRNLQKATITPPNSPPFTVFNHHGFWNEDPLGNEESAQKMKQVAQIVGDTLGPKVVCGDLNLKPGSPALKYLTQHVSSLTEEHLVPSTLTQFGKAQGVACDHICVSEDIEVLSFGVSDDLVSDHNALILSYEYEGLSSLSERLSA